MKNLYFQLGAIFLMASLLFTQCNSDDDDDGTSTCINDNASGPEYHIEPCGDYELAIENILIDMQDGETLHLKAGTYDFTKGLKLADLTNITIKGDGMDQTYLSFAGQLAGAEGIRGDNLEDFLIMDLTILDAPGDNIKIKDSDGVTFYHIGSEWSGEAKEENGAYGIYPVTSNNVLIDGCYVRGASDAGVYVGQSQNNIVRNCTVEENVAGIEVENCINSDVYNNTMTNNTGGLLIFDLPGLDVIGNGHTCRAFNNNIIDNNFRNFAPAGNIVGQVPPGTGILILSGSNIEIFNNTLTNNNMLGLGIIDYTTLSILGGFSADDENYNPHCSLISMHNNTFSRLPEFPEHTNDMSDVLIANFEADSMPDIVWDGYSDTTVPEDQQKMCAENNTGATAINLRVANFFNGMIPGFEQFDCNLDPLPEVVVDAPLP